MNFNKTLMCHSSLAQRLKENPIQKSESCRRDSISLKQRGRALKVTSTSSSPRTRQFSTTHQTQPGNLHSLIEE